MNFVTDIVATVRSHADLFWRFCTPLSRVHGLRMPVACSLFIAVLLLNGCVTPRVHPPAVVPAPVKPAIKPHSAPAATVVVQDSRGYQHNKNHATLALAKSSQDSLLPVEVGYYMDVLHGRLKQESGSRIDIERQGARIVLSMPLQSTFESGNAQIAQSARELLTSVTRVLSEYRKTLVSVLVRADKAAIPAAKPGLEEQRALAIARYLTSTGLAAKHIVITSSVDPPPASTHPVKSAFVEIQVEPIVHSAAKER